LNKNIKNNLFFLKEEFAEGEGVYISPKGKKYVGKWRMGKRNGKGVITNPVGLRLEGTFVNDELEGKEI
jgi:hypothetical protein